jgi:hypothetical protein
MSGRKQIVTLKEILKREKEAPRDYKDWIKDRELYNALGEALKVMIF